MIVTSVANARTVWLFDLNDLNPRGTYIYDALFAWLIERYRFAKAPAHTRDQVENAWEFLDGKFFTTENIPVEVRLRIYGDGLIGETRSSTTDAEAFLRDVLSSAVREFGLTFRESMVLKKLYVSELNLDSDQSLETIHPRMPAFSETVSKAFGSQCQPASIAFSSAAGGQPVFRFERKANVPFSENKYWSLANLETSTHIELLHQLESLLAPA